MVYTKRIVCEDSKWVQADLRWLAKIKALREMWKQNNNITISSSKSVRGKRYGLKDTQILVAAWDRRKEVPS